jgi:hypothetical protein
MAAAKVSDLYSDSLPVNHSLGVFKFDTRFSIGQQLFSVGMGFFSLSAVDFITKVSFIDKYTRTFMSYLDNTPIGGILISFVVRITSVFMDSNDARYQRAHQRFVVIKHRDLAGSRRQDYRVGFCVILYARQCDQLQFHFLFHS